MAEPEAEEENWMERINIGDDVPSLLDSPSLRWADYPKGEEAEQVQASGEPLTLEQQKRMMRRRMSKAQKLVADLAYKEVKEGGLVDLSFLPPFASEEIRALNEEVMQLEKDLRDTEEGVEEQQERATMMNEHAKRVEQEVTYTQLRADTRRREVATEDNMKKISEMEAQRLKREVCRIEKNCNELTDRMRGLKSDINAGNEKMDQFRLLMQWNQEELYQWTQAAKQKDEDNMALESYTKTDNTVLKDLYLELEKASTALYSLQQQLDDEVSETQSAQIQLNRTAEVFRDLQAERQKLISSWEETVETIHNRDEGIHYAAENFASNNANLRTLRRQLDSSAKTLENEIHRNAAIDKKVELVEGEITNMRDDLKSVITSTKTAEEELELLKSRVHRAMTDLGAQKAKKTQVEEDLANKRQKLEAVDMKLAELKVKVEEEYSLLDTLDKKRHELEKILATEEQNLKVAKKEVQDLRDRHFKESEKLNFVKAKEKDILFEIHGAKSQTKALTNQIHQLETNMVKQEEVLYTAEFQIQCLERKVARASGETSDVEAREFNAKISQLEQELGEKNSEEAIILQQLKKSQDDLRASIRRRDTLTKKLTLAEEKNSEIHLESETGLYALKDCVKEKEEKMLSRDLLQMEVNRLQEMLNQKSDNVYGMENAKKRLEMNMEECRREIERQHERHVSELKSMQEDLHYLLVQRNKLAVAVEKLQHKYEVILGRIKLEPGEERTPNYFIIKAAQEREEMQREGYKLEQDVKQVQAEVGSLEKAFEDVKWSNNLYRNSHKTAATLKLEGDQADLKGVLSQTMDILNSKEAEEQDLVKEAEELQQLIVETEHNYETGTATLKDLQNQVESAEQENETQAQKQRRATVRFEKLSTKLKESYGDEDAERITKEMQLVELRETMTDVLYKLKALMQENPDQAHIICDRVVDAGFKLPSNTSSQKSSSVSGSTRGSISSRSSINWSTPTPSRASRSSRSGSIINMEFPDD